MIERLAVLLTVYNRKEQTRRCLTNLAHQNPIEDLFIDIYLTDDGCSDGTSEMLANDFPYVRVIKGDGSLFWNRGMYTAWTAATTEYTYDYYLWLNDDTYLFDNCIKKLITESFLYQNKAIIIGTTLESNNNNHVTYGGWRKGVLIDPRLNSNRIVDYFNGNIVLIPKYVYNILGKNDWFYRHSLGDFDYGHRAAKANIKMIVCKDILGVCARHLTPPKWKDPTISLKKRLRLLYSVGGNGANPFEFFYYKRKHYGIISALGTFISNHLHVLFPRVWDKCVHKDEYSSSRKQ